ncbi:MAG: T9SS type A sorting domain-containing protein [Flavobacteriales bacterium]|nr:T9SS type A sorting domain-containing protein [Flavobacteriales bacterium]
MGVINNLTHSSAQNGATFSDTVVYAADNNSGRFIIWEIYSDGLSGIGSGPEPTKFLIHPNPATDNFEIQFNELPTTAYTITISDMLGNQVYLEAVNNLENDHTIHAKLNNGFILYAFL